VKGEGERKAERKEQKKTREEKRKQKIINTQRKKEKHRLGVPPAACAAAFSHRRPK